MINYSGVVLLPKAELSVLDIYIVCDVLIFSLQQRTTNYTTSYHMSDRYFPSSPPSEDELRLILLLRYVPSSVKTKEGFFTVNVRNWELGTASDPGTILVPVRYQEHLRRFLWREMIFMEVIRRCTLREIYLVATVSPLVKRYIMYMDGILEGLLTTARKRQDDVKYRSVLFEMYLNVEYFVGRHEFDIAGQWRESHPDTILECQDALQLGELIFIHVNIHTQPHV